MSHMNYFEPFESKPGGHEDHLTRAFLVLLRFNPTVFLMFYDAIRESCLELAERLKHPVNILPSSVLPISAVDFNTQTRAISHGPVDSVLSVLLTDEPIEVDFLVEPSDRTATYDGVIVCGSEIAIIIENKPSHANVWQEQLSPSKKDLPEDSTLIEVPAVVEWKNIIRSLNQIRGMESIGGAEGLMIDDFLSYVNNHYSFLNPFDRLALCGTNNKLIKNRIEELLKSIAVKQDSVRYNPRWGWYIYVGQPDVESIGVIDSPVTVNSGQITVSLYFGDTQTQAKRFYNRKIKYEHIDEYLRLGWGVVPNFHCRSFMTAMMRLDTPIGHKQKYYEYWINHPELMKERDLNSLLKFLENLGRTELVSLTDEFYSEVDRIKATNYKKFSICPSMGLLYDMSIERARELDNDRNDLASELYMRMNEGLSLVLGDTSKILKEPQNRQQ